ncbi:hypothetical protein EE612_007497, partial [Oryza sativa]
RFLWPHLTIWTKKKE